MNMKLILIPLAIGLVIGLALGYSVGYAMYQPQVLKPESTVFEEPSPLNGELKSMQDVRNDLGNLGCKIVYLTKYGETVSNGFLVANYTEFRKIAYNSKVVFLYYESSGGGTYVELYTILNGIIVKSALQLPLPP